MKNYFKLRELLVIFHIQRIIQASGNDVQYSIASSIYKLEIRDSQNLAKLGVGSSKKKMNCFGVYHVSAH